MDEITQTTGTAALVGRTVKQVRTNVPGLERVIGRTGTVEEAFLERLRVEARRAIVGAAEDRDLQVAGLSDSKTFSPSFRSQKPSGRTFVTPPRRTPLQPSLYRTRYLAISPPPPSRTRREGGSPDLS